MGHLILSDCMVNVLHEGEGLLKYYERDIKQVKIACI